MLDHSNIYIASDHAGYKLKSFIIEGLVSAGYKISDLGAYNEDSSDYPDYAEKLSNILKGDNEFGILICGSGIGMSIAANRYKHIRAALCCNKEMALLARKHNNANVIVLGARFLDNDIAFEMVEAFINTEFEGERHNKRVLKLMSLGE